VGLLLCDADLAKDVEDLFAFHFQLASQIVDSNLHPPFVSFNRRCPHLPGGCGCADARHSLNSY